MLYIQKGIDALVAKNYDCYKTLPGNFYLIKTYKDPKFFQPGQAKVSTVKGWSIPEGISVSAEVDVFFEGSYCANYSPTVQKFTEYLFSNGEVVVRRRESFHKSEKYGFGGPNNILDEKHLEMEAA